MTIEAVAVVHAEIARTDAEVPRGVRIDRVERTRPVEAVRPCIVETRPIAEAGRGQEETVAVLRGEESAVHAALRRPYMRRVLV